jgi:uncharacterized protein (TIGR02466 family)
MSDQFYVNSLFPSFVVHKDFEIENKKNILKYSREILKKFSNQPFYSLCSSTVKTKADILELPEFLSIRNQIIECVGAYCQATKLSQENLAFADSWLNEYKIGGYQDLHLHSASTLSGVYYLESEGAKDLVFQAPWHFFQSIEPRVENFDLTNCHNVEFNSVPGRCYIFMSHLMHRTLPAKKPRMSLSFNIHYT